MTYEEARNFIQSHVASNWTATPSGTIAYDNLPFTPPTGEPWVRLTVQNNQGFQAGLGGPQRRFRRLGNVILQVFVPEGEGPTEATQIAEQGILLFEAVTLTGGLRFDRVSLREVGVENGWFQVNVAADFAFDHVR